MPFKSKRQMRFFVWKGNKSKKWKKRAQEWATETPDIKKLPEKIKSNSQSGLRKSIQKRKR